MKKGTGFYYKRIPINRDIAVSKCINCPYARTFSKEMGKGEEYMFISCTKKAFTKIHYCTVYTISKCDYTDYEKNIGTFDPYETIHENCPYPYYNENDQNVKFL